MSNYWDESIYAEVDREIRQDYLSERRSWRQELLDDPDGPSPLDERG